MNIHIDPISNGNQYEIFFVDDYKEHLQHWIKQNAYQDIILLVDSQLASQYGQSLSSILNAQNFNISVLPIPNGEKNKNLSTYIQLLNQLDSLNISRSHLIISLGGGVTGDIGGFLAATSLRGVDYIQVPTSLLAMVDSSVGSKVGVNTLLGKNRVGAFYSPKAVFIDVQFLQTLPKREMNCGLGEMLKHGLLADREILEMCNTDIYKLCFDSPKRMKELVFKNCLVKSKIVNHDPKENSLRMLLNFGHTVGHAIEKVFNYTTYSHGECVSYGLLSEMKWAVNIGELDPKVPTYISQILNKNKVQPSPKIKSIDPFLHAAHFDKKKKHDTINVILLKDITKPKLVALPLNQLSPLFSPLLETS